MLCFQEVFTGPYFCPSQDTKWYGLAEEIPNGPTTRLMQELAKKHTMVIVVPIYEEHMTGVYYNTAAVIDADGKYLGKYRKNHIPQVAGFWEKFFFKPGNLGYPGFRNRLRQSRRLHLLRPPLPRRRARSRPERRRDRFQSVGNRRRALAVSLGARAARARGGQRLLRRRDQSRGQAKLRGISASFTARLTSPTRAAKSSRRLRRTKTSC